MLGVVFVRRLREGRTDADFVVDGDHDVSGAPAPLPDDRRGYPWR